MYSSYLTRETFENEHDEKMTRKFSYNYQVLKRLFPEVYKLPESEIRSLVHSIYDNPKMGDELLDHLSDVINKKKPEWGEYLNPKPEEPEQTVQNNPLQPVQPKPLNTSLGFEPYKPQKSAFGLGNSGSFGGLNNTNNFGNTGGLNGLNTAGGLKQSQLPNFSKGMDLKHSDMVTGFGINEAKQKSMFGFNPQKYSLGNGFQPRSTNEWLQNINHPQNYEDIERSRIYNNVRPKNISVSPEDEMLATNRLAHYVAIPIQGMATEFNNKILSPFTNDALNNYIHPIVPENDFEKYLEKGGAALYNQLIKKTFK